MKKKILLADDDSDTLLLLNKILVGKGYEVQCLNNAAAIVNGEVAQWPIRARATTSEDEPDLLPQYDLVHCEKVHLRSLHKSPKSRQRKLADSFKSFLQPRS